MIPSAVALVGSLLVATITALPLFYYTAGRSSAPRPLVARWAGFTGLWIGGFLAECLVLSWDQAWLLVFPFAGVAFGVDALQRIAATNAAGGLERSV